MTKQDIYAILDKNAAVSRTTMKFIIVVGAILMITGICFGIFREQDKVALLSIFCGLGLLLSIWGIVVLSTNSFEKRTAAIKDILDNNPSHLVWGYVLKQNNRGAVSINVVMNFKDGKTFQISDDAIPGKDTTAMLRLLQQINPAMHMGYSEELEYKFKKRTL